MTAAIDTPEKIASRVNRSIKRSYRLMAELNALDTTTFANIQLHISADFVGLLAQQLADYDVGVVLLHDGKRE